MSPGAQLTVPWNPAFNAMAYVLLGQGYAGDEGRPVSDHQLVVFGPGDTLTLRAADHQDGPTDALEVLLLGGLPIREPIAHYGPFVMNTREEILQAVDDFNAGRMGTIPAVDLGLTPSPLCDLRGVVRDTSNDTCSVEVGSGGRAASSQRAATPAGSRAARSRSRATARCSMASKRRR